MRFLYPPLFFLALLLLNGCARVYHTPDAKTISSDHKLVAIMPPLVSIQARRRDYPDELRQQEITESNIIQKELHNWLLKRQMNGEVHINFQDVQTTNIKLEREGFFDRPAMTPAEVCQLLEVDAIIQSDFALNRPISEVGAVAMDLLFGQSVPTREAIVSLDLFDANHKKLIWTYNHRLSGQIGSTHAGLVNSLMRNASKKMPYFK